MGFMVAFVALGILILNVLLFFWKVNKFPKSIRILGIYLSINLATELLAKYIAYFFENPNNLPLLHIYTLLEFITWPLFYRQLFVHKNHFVKNHLYFIGFVSVLILSNSIFLEPLSGFNSNAKALVQIILIGYAIYYFFETFGKIDLTKPLPRALSLINFAVILYYSGSLFIFMFSKLLANQNVADNRQYGFWAVNALLLVAFQTLIFISLWTVAFQKTKSSSSLPSA